MIFILILIAAVVFAALVQIAYEIRHATDVDEDGRPL